MPAPTTNPIRRCPLTQRTIGPVGISPTSVYAILNAPRYVKSDDWRRAGVAVPVPSRPRRSKRSCRGISPSSHREPSVRRRVKARDQHALTGGRRERHVRASTVDRPARGRVDLQDLVRHAVADEQRAARDLVRRVDDDALGAVSRGGRVDEGGPGGQSARGARVRARRSGRGPGN